MSTATWVALVKGDERYGNVARALELIADQIDVAGKERILIKPNFVVTNVPLAATHVDAVRAVLDFLRPRTDAWITIAEGAAIGDSFEGFRRYGYTDLVKEYKVELADINRGEWIEVPVYDGTFKTKKLRLSKTVAESDFRISVGPPKTHESVIATLSLKNMVMGALIRDQREESDGSAALGVMKVMYSAIPDRIKMSGVVTKARTAVAGDMFHSDKNAMHMGIPIINLNLYRLAPYAYPHLAVIDGFVGMEGNGPTQGDPVDLRCAVASTDFLAADTVGAALMGFNVDDIGYLHYCKIKGMGEGDVEKMTILGNTLAECRHPFRPSPHMKNERYWAIKNVERLL